MTRQSKKGIAVMSVGVLLFFMAIALGVYNYYTEYKAGVSSDAIMDNLALELPKKETESAEQLPDYIINPGMDLPVKAIDGNEYVGKIEIFSLDLELPVMNEWSYSNFKIAPCRYEGTPYKDNIIIAAHNYRSHFGALKQLKSGDKISFTDMNNNVFDYEVIYMEVLDRNALDDLLAGEWDLTLFTCTPGGQNRVTVRCERIEK